MCKYYHKYSSNDSKKGLLQLAANYLAPVRAADHSFSQKEEVKGTACTHRMDIETAEAVPLLVLFMKMSLVCNL